MENDKIQLGFDAKRKMLTTLKFKAKDLSYPVQMDLIRYNGYYSESGAYIFAPGDQGHPLHLKPVGAYYLNSTFQNQFLIFYKSIYKASCFGFI